MGAFEDFCKNTSLRGVRRVVDGRDVLLRTFWLVVVLLCTAGLTWHVADLCSGYLRYSTYLVKELQQLSTKPFPDIYVCNRNFFSTVGYQHFENNKIMSPTNYSHKIRRLLARNNSSGLELLQYDTFEGYFQNMPRENLSRIVHTKKDIFYCLVVLRGGEHKFPLDSRCALTITPLWHSSRFRCFKLSVPSKYSRATKSVIFGMTTTKPVLASFNKHVGNGMLYEAYHHLPVDGISVDLNSNNDDPDISKSVEVKSGSSIKISFTTNVLNRMKGACTERLGNVEGVRVGKCQAVEFNKLVNKTCHCVPVRNSLVDESMNITKFCMYIDETNTESSIAKFKCLKAQEQADVYHRCKHICQTVWYSQRTSSYDFDHGNLFHIYRKTVFDGFKTTSFEGEISDNSSTAADITTFTKAIEAATTKINMSNTTDMNRWVNVEVTHGGNQLIVYNETLIISWPTFISQLGGACSLWLGLTITFVADICDLIIIFVISRCKKPPRVTET